MATSKKAMKRGAAISQSILNFFGGPGRGRGAVRAVAADARAPDRTAAIALPPPGSWLSAASPRTAPAPPVPLPPISHQSSSPPAAPEPLPPISHQTKKSPASSPRAPPEPLPPISHQNKKSPASSPRAPPEPLPPRRPPQTKKRPAPRSSPENDDKKKKKKQKKGNAVKNENAVAMESEDGAAAPRDTKRQTPSCLVPYAGARRQLLQQQRKEGPGEMDGGLWVDKYRPRRSADIVGQQALCDRLRKWLASWHDTVRAAVLAGKASRRGASAAAARTYRAALVSGPPGIGKTTAAVLVSLECGFRVLEMNASDTRSKARLGDRMREALHNSVINDAADAATTARHVYVMDEVDGMAGNEDRGGLAELVDMIRNTGVPIVCICNDRGHPKMRSLASHCLDLRAYSPHPRAIAIALCRIAAAEKLRVGERALTDIVAASANDVRQSINALALWRGGGGNGSGNGGKTKDVRLGPFQLTRALFAIGESLSARADLFFQDYNAAPLFVQENYCAPGGPGDLCAVAAAADSISAGDLAETQIRKRGDWSLLPAQAMFSAAIPAHLMRGAGGGPAGCGTGFPTWFGKTSTTNKRLRLAAELRHRLCGRVSADRTQLCLDYAEPLLHALYAPMTTAGGDEAAGGGVRATAELVRSYGLQRADLDSLAELATWPGLRPAPQSALGPKTKAALTRCLGGNGGDVRLRRGKQQRIADEDEAAESDGQEEEEQGAGLQVY